MTLLAGRKAEKYSAYSRRWEELHTRSPFPVEDGALVLIRVAGLEDQQPRQLFMEIRADLQYRYPHLRLVSFHLSLTCTLIKCFTSQSLQHSSDEETVLPSSASLA
jgi:hypothetical protein